MSRICGRSISFYSFLVMNDLNKFEDEGSLKKKQCELNAK